MNIQNRTPRCNKVVILIPSSDPESDCDDREPDSMRLGKPELIDNKLNDSFLTKSTPEGERDLSLYCAEDERAINDYQFYSPESNTSINNLNFSNNFVTANNSHNLSESLNTPPDIQKVQSQDQWQIDDDCTIEIADGTVRFCSQSTQHTSQVPPSEEFHSLQSSSGAALSSTVRSYASLPDPDDLRAERVWLTLAIDMKVIEPFQRVMSHGGYCADGKVIIVFSACHLPERTRHDYSDVMHNLLLYVLWILERLVTNEYVLVYLHGGADRRRMPSCTWMYGCYQLLGRRLRKDLKHLYLVHPTLWLKSFVFINKAFVSSKFFRKLTYVRSLGELLGLVPVDPNVIPDAVKQLDGRRG